jgi:hypothetical protein
LRLRRLRVRARGCSTPSSSPSHRLGDHLLSRTHHELSARSCCYARVSRSPRRAPLHAIT